MSAVVPPLFTSFDDAWRWFLDGGELVPIDAQRERFTAGRAQFLTFEISLAEHPVADDIEDLQSELGDIAEVQPSPPELLHISVRGVGWQVIEKTRPDEVLRQEVGAISERAARILRSHAPFDVVIGPLNVFPDALILEVHEETRLRELRTALEDAAGADAFGLAGDTFLPHVTIGWFRTPASSPAMRQMLTLLREREPLRATIHRIDLARYWFTGLGAEDEEVERDTVRTYRLR